MYFLYFLMVQVIASRHYLFNVIIKLCHTDKNWQIEYLFVKLLMTIYDYLT